MENRTQVQPQILFEGQLQALHEVLDILTVAKTRTLVILEGFSGIGKSTSLKELQNLTAKSNCVVIDLDYPFAEIEKHLPTDKHIVISSLYRDRHSRKIYLRDKFSDFVIRSVFVRGMNTVETIKFVNSLSIAEGSEISAEEICRYSLGVPFLAEILARSNVSKENLAQLTKRYLIDQLDLYISQSTLDKGFSDWLQMDVPSDVLDELQNVLNFSDKKIYDSLYRVLKNQESFRQNGRIELSPLFVCKQSEEIYNEALKRQDATGHHREVWVDIFAPLRNPEWRGKVLGSLGFGILGFYRHGNTRIEMFGANLRKSFFLYADVSGKVAHSETEEHFLSFGQDRVKEFRRLWNANFKDDYGAVARKQWFYFHSHEHEGMTENTALFGWAIESLLQRVGVPYIARNRGVGKTYFYSPTSRSLVFLQE